MTSKKRPDECRLHDRGSRRVEPRILVSYYCFILFYTMLTSINRVSTWRWQETTEKAQMMSKKRPDECRLHDRGSRRVEPQILVSFYWFILFFTMLTSINRVSTRRRQETTEKAQVRVAGARAASSPFYKLSTWRRSETTKQQTWRRTMVELTTTGTQDA